MKTMELDEMIMIQGGNEVTEFLDGVACGYGLATIATGFGAALAIYGCGRVMGFW